MRLRALRQTCVAAWQGWRAERERQEKIERARHDVFKCWERLEDPERRIVLSCNPGQKGGIGELGALQNLSGIAAAIRSELQKGTGDRLYNFEVALRAYITVLGETGKQDTAHASGLIRAIRKGEPFKSPPSPTGTG